MFSFLQMLLLHPHRYHPPPRPQEALRRRRVRSQRRGWRRKRPAAPGAGQVSAPVPGVWRPCLSGAALGPSLLGVLGAGHPDSTGATGPAHWPRRWVVEAPGPGLSCRKVQPARGPAAALEVGAKLCRCSGLNPRPLAADKPLRLPWRWECESGAARVPAPSQPS